MRLLSVVLLSLILQAPGDKVSAAQRPEPQAWKTGPGLSPSITTFGVYADASDVNGFWPIAARLAAWLPQPPGVAPPLRDLSELGQHTGENEIVVGNPAMSPRVADMVAQHGLSMLDLGVEGYWLDSRIPPDGSCPWRVLIVANDPAGARAGAGTLLDSFVGNTDVIQELRIRDYPDRPQRGFFYHIGTIGELTAGAHPLDVPGWLAARKAGLDSLAKLGVNTVYVSGNDWFRMQTEVTPAEGNPGNYPDLRRGARLRDLFDYCRMLRMEPVPYLLFNTAPYTLWEDSLHATWREGKLIEGERFIAAQGETLFSNASNFNNRFENLDWQDIDPATGLPRDWFFEYPQPWTWDPVLKRWSISNFSGSSALTTVVWIIPGDFYVLRATFKRIQFESNPCPPNQNCRPNVHIRDWGDAIPNRRWIKYCYLRSDPATGTFVYECPFRARAEDLVGNEVAISIETNGGTNVSLELSEITLDRRNSGFVNLMRSDTTSYGGETFPGLDLVIKTDSSTPTVFQEGIDYVVENGTPWRTLNWRMSSLGPISRIHWLTPTPTYPVKVTWTAGVPADHLGGNTNATTWCLNNGALYAEWERVFRDLFGSPGFGLNPKFVRHDLDEVRGMNRCGRCDQAGLSNRDYLVAYLNRLQGILNSIPGGEQTRGVVDSDMLSPQHNGGIVDYQSWAWLGQQGATGVSVASMPTLLDTMLVMHMWSIDEAHAARAAGWPPASHLYLAAPESDHDPEAWATDDTWYGPRSLGYTIMKWVRHALPTLSDNRMLDYAWKRHGHPDATMHAYVGTEYKTDDAVGREVVLGPGGVLTIRPFGRPGWRDPDCTAPGPTLSTASIAWGEGTPTNVLNGINSQSYTHTFNSAGQRTVTLTVTDEGCSGTGTATKQVTIPVRVLPPGGCLKNCPTESSLLPAPVVDLAPGIRAIQPNPFGETATLHFTVPGATTPEVCIYDLRGRRVVDTRLAEHPAGAWQWSWDGRDGEGRALAAGVYFIRVRLGDHVESRRLVKLGN